MKVLFIALVICAVAFAATVDKDKAPAEAAKPPADNKTAHADKPAREARYFLLNSGRVYDRVLDNVVSDVVVSRSSYIVDSPVSSQVLIY